MKKINGLTYFLLSLCSVLLFACGGSKDSKENESGFSFSASAGVKLDANTGTKTSYSGFSVDEIYVVDAEDKQLANNEIPLDTKFSIVYQGIENYTAKDGKVFPGLSLQVTDASGADVLNEADLLASYTEGVSPEDGAIMRGSVTVGEPMKSGETYHCKIRVFDKNSDAEIVSELDFKVK
ncbi:MAG TPA: hypothetical protein PL167_00455 [Cyclobacteriaceae bacterium]|nr:hypothetical protein [Cyclobacteriaceae bacterium]